MTAMPRDGERWRRLYVAMTDGDICDVSFESADMLNHIGDPAVKVRTLELRRGTVRLVEKVSA